MTMFNYESEEIYQMARGETNPSSPVYVAECKKEILTEVTPNYPKLTEYEKEWMSFAKNIYKDGTPVPLEYLEVQTDDQATVTDVIPFTYKSAIFKGNTKYRDIDTGDILDTFDETKNLELVSVQMPVLTTTGKNLILYTDTNKTVNINQNPKDIIYEDGGFNFNESNNNWNSVWYDLNLKPNTNYTISYNSNFMDCSIFKSKVTTYVSSEIVSQVGIKNKKESHVQFTTLTFTSPSKGFVRIRLTNTQKSGYHVVTNLQLEENSQATSYEPYQSNILTDKEDVELRGIDNVKDELNLITGELTERTREVTLNGNEEWTINNENNGGVFSCITTTYIGVPNGKVICDQLPSVTSSKYEGVMIGKTTGQLIVAFDRKKSGVTSLETFKAKLAKLQLKVCYEIENTIKTVDLNRMIKPYEGTNHYTVSSHTIPPLLLLLVPIESTGNQTLNDIITEE